MLLKDIYAIIRSMMVRYMVTTVRNLFDTVADECIRLDSVSGLSTIHSCRYVIVPRQKYPFTRAYFHLICERLGQHLSRCDAKIVIARYTKDQIPHILRIELYNDDFVIT